MIAVCNRKSGSATARETLSRQLPYGHARRLPARDVYTYVGGTSNGSINVSAGPVVVESTSKAQCATFFEITSGEQRNTPGLHVGLRKSHVTTGASNPSPLLHLCLHRLVRSRDQNSFENDFSGCF